jgi:hypothetical protein
MNLVMKYLLYCTNLLIILMKYLHYLHLISIFLKLYPIHNRLKEKIEIKHIERYLN